MGIINLTTAEAKDESAIPYKKGIISIIAVGIVMALIYGGIYFYKTKLAEKISVLDSKYGGELSKLTESKNKDVVDFQNRIVMAKSMVAERSMAVEGLTEMEKDILPGVYAETYEYDRLKNEIKLNCVADNIDLISKQILIFKKSGFFQEVYPGEIKSQEKGMIAFTINLKVKN